MQPLLRSLVLALVATQLCGCPSSSATIRLVFPDQQQLERAQRLVLRLFRGEDTRCGGQRGAALDQREFSLPPGGALSYPQLPLRRLVVAADVHDSAGVLLVGCVEIDAEPGDALEIVIELSCAPGRDCGGGGDGGFDGYLDHGGDAAAEDAIVDGGDAAAEDAIVDGPPADDGQPDATQSPCRSAYGTLWEQQGTFAACAPHGGQGVNQCAAALLCNENAGWVLCPASVYRTAYGGSAPFVSNAWIAGCVRDHGGSPYPPVDEACSNCAVLTTDYVEVSWNCTGGAYSSGNAEYIGVATFGVCNRVGSNSPSTAAYWIGTPAWATSPTMVLCCQP